MASGDSMPYELKKIHKFLEDRRKMAENQLSTYDNIYVLSDSKGKYLKSETYNVQDIADISNFTFWFRGGRTTAAGIEFLEDKLSSNYFKSGRSVVLFWHVTCDLN